MKKLITFGICLAFAANVFAADKWEHTQIPTEHTNLFLAVAVSPDGTQLTAASLDGTIHRRVNATAVARRNSRRLAFAQAMHPSLGAKSPTNVLPRELYVECICPPAAHRAWYDPRRLLDFYKEIS